MGARQPGWTAHCSSIKRALTTNALSALKLSESSRFIANKHYLTVTDQHFEMAAATDTQSGGEIWGQTGDVNADAGVAPARMKKPES